MVGPVLPNVGGGTAAAEMNSTETSKTSAEAPVFDLSSMTKKKKKKKPKAEPESSTVIDEMPPLDSLTLDDAEQEEEVIDFPAPDFTRKKKRWRKPKVEFTEVDDGAARVVRRAAVKQAWDGTERDYTYSELINRAFQFLHGKNPALAASSTGRKKISLQLPQVAREGTKKTVFLNFGAICKSIHRQQDHLLQYMGAELGTTGNIQDGGRLVVKGRFTAEAIVKVLKRYMTEYVICTSCRSPDTVLMRDANTRLYFVSCESCGAKRSVAQIRQGFMAQVERRKKT